jgi:hypothetical protein
MLTFRRVFLAFLAALLVAGGLWILFLMIVGETMIFGDAEIEVGEVTTVSPPSRR